MSRLRVSFGLVLTLSAVARSPIERKGMHGNTKSRNPIVFRVFVGPCLVFVS